MAWGSIPKCFRSLRQQSRNSPFPYLSPYSSLARCGPLCWKQLLTGNFAWLFIYSCIYLISDKLAPEIHFFLKKHRVYCERDCFSSFAEKMFLIFALGGL